MKKLYSPFFLRTAFVVLLMLSFVRGWGQTTLVEWNFPDTGADDVADAGITVNLTKVISPNGGVNTIAYTAAGATTRSISGANWSSGSGSKFWQVEFATTGYKTIKLSSKQRSSNTGPRDFKAQYKITATGTWTDISGGGITIANNFTSGVLSNVSLPVATENTSSVFVRWIMTSNTGVNGSATQNGGISNIDDIIITGVLDCTPPTPTFTASPIMDVCKGIDIIYTTQSGKTDYVWNVSGTLNTDYSIVSGGLGTGSNTVTLRWLTGGSKTVTVGYTESGCPSATPASSTINVSNTTIAPITPQTIPVGVDGAKLTVTEQVSAATSRVWKYGTESGVYTTSTANTTTEYFPNFTSSGTYYVVCESTFACGVITSNEVVINVNAPTVTITGSTPTLFTYAEGQGPSAYQTLNVSGANLADNINVTVPTNWEISINASATTWLSTIPLTKSSTTHAVNSTPIHIRLKAGLAQGQYNFSTDDDFKATSGLIVQSSDLDGEVTAPVPFIDVKSTTTPFPSILNGTNVPIGTQNTLWAARAVNTSEAKTYTIHNLGGSPLTISSVTIAGANPLDFTVSTPPPSTIAAGASATFAVTFSPTMHGVSDAIVRIANNSNNIQPYFDFNVRGTGNNAEIEVTGNGNAVSNGNTIISSTNNTLIGTANLNPANPTTISKDFVITNSGNVTLNISAITLSGADASQFSVTPSTATISAGSTGTITVTFAPTSSGVKNAIINIANNDLTDNENPYTFAVQGNAVSFIACAPGDPIIIKSQDFEGTNPLANTAKWTGTVYPTGPGATDKVYVGVYPTSVVGEIGVTETSAIGTKSFNITNRSEVDSYLLLGIVNLTTHQNSSLSFKLASFGASAGNGNDGNDWLAVETNDGSGWIQKILISGAAGTSSQTKWSYSSGIGIAENDYSNSLASFAPATGGYATTDGYGTVILKNLPSIANLQIRFRGSNGGNEIWAVDNIVLYKEGEPAEKTWNGTNWINSSAAVTTAPTSTQKAIFTNDYNSASNGGSVTACACEIQSTKTVTIGADDVLDIQDNINNAGSLVIESDGNLIQHNDLASNTGEITLKRDSKMKRGNYTYWSSPVNGQNLKTFSPGTLNTRFFTYDESDDMFDVIDPLTNDFADNGKGYSIRASNNYTGTTNTYVFTGKFEGTPNNGEKTIAVTKTTNGNNLIGNPYPSNIDFRDLVTDNPAVFNGGAEAVAYFWTNLNPNPAMQGTGYPGTGYFNNYATLNMSGGVPATLVVDPDDSSQNSNGETPTYYIKPGQGFIIKVAASGDLTFRNNMRKVGDGSVFFNNNKRAEEQTDRFWISLQSPMGAVTTQLIAYLPNATNGFDGQGYDAKIGTLGADAFYSKIENDKFAIQGRGSFAITDQVDLGTSHYEAGIHSIALGKKEGVFANGQHIYLKDKHTNTITDLSAGDYVFNAVAGNTEGRFEIVYENDLVLGTDNQVRKNLIIYRNGDEFIIKSNDDKITEVELYDSVGRLLITVKPNATEARINVSHLSNAFYVLKIDQNGKVSSKKVIK